MATHDISKLSVYEQILWSLVTCKNDSFTHEIHSLIKGCRIKHPSINHSPSFVHWLVCQSICFIFIYWFVCLNCSFTLNTRWTSLWGNNIHSDFQLICLKLLLHKFCKEILLSDSLCRIWVTFLFHVTEIVPKTSKAETSFPLNSEWLNDLFIKTVTVQYTVCLFFNKSVF